MRTPPAPDGRAERPRPPRRRFRRALYAATVLAPLGGLAMFAAAHRGGGVLAPVSPVQQAMAQQPPPTDEAPPPPAAEAAPSASDANEGAALGVLLEQANFWRARQRYDQAITSLDRAQKVAPDNPDMLALLAQVQLEKGDPRAAAAALDRLRKAAPGDPRIEKIDSAIKVGPISPDQLADARKLAQAGKQAEAMERYNRVLKGNPPPDALAVEYYQTLAGAAGGYDQAREGLARLVRENPQDLRAQLAYAQVLTYRDAYRLEGIQRLTALAQNPAIADLSTQAWRQALGWLPDSKESTDALQSYLASHPNDVELASKLEKTKNPLLTAPPPVRSRVAGFEALNAGKLADAEKLFQAAIDADANDADAIGGLGIVKLRQRNFAAAKPLLARAIALDPEHKGRWESALTAASNPGGGPNPAVAMINRGDFVVAARELNRQSAQGGDVTGLRAMLADAEARQGRLDEAEATYRTALARSPNNAQVLVGLAGVLARQGRNPEASELLDRAQAVAGNSRLVGQARALQLREQAAGITDPATQIGLYRAAVAADPENPWLRLDLARVLFKRGETQEARELMAEVIGTSPTPDALKAGIIFANETSDPDAAASLIARLPPGMRTPDMLALQMQATLQREIGAALLLSRPTARQRLLAMAPRPDPSGARGAALARALGEIGDKMAGREAVIAAQASTPNQGAAARLRYAGALMDIDDASGAQDMLAEVGSGRGLSPGDRQEFVQLQAGLAVRASDKLNEQGRQADAYDHLAPVLAQAPENPDLNLALARLYQGARNPREALQISETLLRRDPRNVDARKAAVETALQLGDRHLADQLVREGQQLSPNDPRTWMMSAELDRARGNNGRALRDLERARDLRLQQLGYSNADTGADRAPPPGAAPTDQPFAPQPAYRPTLPNADGGADQPQEPSVPPPVLAPPAPPFTPQATNALGAPPSYQPPAAASALPSRQPVQDAQAPGREQAVVAVPVYPPSPFQASAPAPQPDPAPAAAVRPYQVAQAAQYAPEPTPLYAPQDAPQSVQPYRADYAPSAPPQYQPFKSSPAPPPPSADRWQGYYANPFRPNPGGTVSATDALSPVVAAAPDPETQEIDRNIVALRDTLAPSVQAGFGVQQRSGQSGLDELSNFTLPMEATFSPGGTGQLKLAVTPTVLTSGQIGGNAVNQQLFGTNALALTSTLGVVALSGQAQQDQHASGVGLDVGYSYGSVKADIGATPLGFQYQNVVGGVEWAPQLSDHVRLRLLAERRAVTDSVLSYAGTEDPRTGDKWGGVVRDHGRATLEFSAGRADFYVLAGGAGFYGNNVQSNAELEAGAGGSYPVYRSTTQEVRVGLDLIYFGYTHNQDFFTIGNGGYFSPQSFVEALVPVTYKETLAEDLSYEVGGSIGYASFRESPQPYFPTDAGLQAQLIAQQTGANAVAGVLSEYPGQTVSGVAGTLHGSVDYRVTPSLRLGGNVDFQYSPAYNQTTAVVFAKYLFNGADQ